jgi:hypothetical protein
MKNCQSSLLKNIFFALALPFLLFSCTKEKAMVTRTTYLENAAVYKSVTKEEYLKASVLERRFIDQIDGAVNALDIMKKNNPQQVYVAIITIDKDPNNKLHNSILIGIAESENNDLKTDADVEPAPDGKCHVCGLMSAYSCISEVEKYMNSKNQDSISATITRTADNCVDIKYH